MPLLKPKKAPPEPVPADAADAADVLAALYEHPPTAPRCCFFCMRDGYSVHVLVANKWDTAFICNDCVLRALYALLDEDFGYVTRLTLPE